MAWHTLTMLKRTEPENILYSLIFVNLFLGKQIGRNENIHLVERVVGSQSEIEMKKKNILEFMNIYSCIIVDKADINK